MRRPNRVIQVAGILEVYYAADVLLLDYRLGGGIQRVAVESNLEKLADLFVQSHRPDSPG